MTPQDLDPQTLVVFLGKEGKEFLFVGYNPDEEKSEKNPLNLDPNDPLFKLKDRLYKVGKLDLFLNQDPTQRESAFCL